MNLPQNVFAKPTKSMPPLNEEQERARKKAFLKKFFLDIVILTVAFDVKDQAKKAGAKWDWDNKYWYCEKNEKEIISKCRTRYLDVEFCDKDRVKRRFGSGWDALEKKWYINPALLSEEDLNEFQEWFH